MKSPPADANRLEALQGDHRGQHSIRINSRWTTDHPGAASF
jgi:plasmid maintenance system killer protein